MNRKHCVITGNPVDGLFVIGPFDSYDDAIDWACAEQEGQDWWVTDMRDPGEEA